MEEVRLIDANALHKRIEMNLHASNPFTIEECCYKDALNSVDEAPHHRAREPARSCQVGEGQGIEVYHRR